jgi:hypothetical protein
MDMGSSVFGRIFPAKTVRNQVSRGASTSPITMCVSSCLDINPMRSAEGKVSKLRSNGSMPIWMKSMGTVPAPPYPVSSKS